MSTLLLDRLLNRETRVDALEVALVARALIEPGSMPYAVDVSAPCALVLNAIFARHYADPNVALVATVVHHVAWETVELQRAAVALAEDVAALTVQDLTSIGDLGTVLTLLVSERQATPENAKAA